MDLILGVIFFALLAIFLFMVYVNGRAADRRAVAEAVLELENSLKRYKKSLENLKRDPNNSDLRQIALELGRRYANLTRTNNARTIFDEVALANHNSFLAFMYQTHNLAMPFVNKARVQTVHALKPPTATLQTTISEFRALTISNQVKAFYRSSRYWSV